MVMQSVTPRPAHPRIRAEMTLLPSAMRRPWRVLMLWAAASLTVPCHGCIELQFLLGTLPPNQTDDGNGGIGNGNGGSNGQDSGALRVTLTASNVAPELNENVTLRCTLVSGDPDGVTFSFSPASRLTVDSEAGTAQFFVEQADIGVAFTFTCSAANRRETSPPSSPILITPSETLVPG